MKRRLARDLSTIAALLIGAACSGLSGYSAQPPTERFTPTSITPQQLLTRADRIASKPLPAGLFLWSYRTVEKNGYSYTSDYYETRNGYRLVEKFDGVSIELGTKAGHAWRSDVNGLVVADVNPPDEFDRAWSEAARKPDPRVRVLGITITPPYAYVIELRLNNQTIQRYYYDVKTLRALEFTKTSYGHTQDTRYLAYTDFYGIPLVVRSVESDTAGGTSSESTLVRNERLPFDARLVSPPRSRIAFVARAPLPAAVDSWFGKKIPGTFVRAKIGGRDYWMALRPTSSVIGIDRQLAETLGLRWIGSSYVVLPHIDIGPLSAENLVVQVYSTYSFWAMNGIRGFVGSDFFAAAPLAIDYQHQTVTTLRSAPAAADRRWAAVSTPLHAWQPLISMRLDGHPATLAFDFGAQDTRINAGFFDRFGGGFQRNETFPVPLDFLRKQSFFGGNFIVPHATAGGLDFGPLPAGVFFYPSQQYLNADGLLAQDAIGNLRLIWDYVQQRTYFQR